MLHERLHVIDLLPPGSLSVGKTSVTTMQSIISKASQYRELLATRLPHVVNAKEQGREEQSPFLWHVHLL